MTAYEELLEFGGERIFDFLKNARLHESQFKYSEFNEVCYKKMYIENNQDSIKTVKELKEEIPELKDTCKGCGSYFMNPRNKSIKGLDVQFGRLLEDVIIDFLKTKYKLNVTHGDNSNKKYPDCMLLSGDKGILAYFEVKYHGAPFISAINKIGRYCYEGSATLDLNKLVKQIEIVESELDRPVFYLHWIDYPCLKGLFFETSDQVKNELFILGEEFNREEREGDFNESGKKTGYTGSSVIYSNIIAFSMLPIIFFSPIAGWICDYVKKKKLIVMLDFTSGIILSLFFLLSNKVIAICIILFILGILGTLETPATQTAVPLITDDLNKTNTEIAQISSISAILAPILGGVIYNTFSINKIIIFSIIGFGITAFLESLIKMKNEQCIRDSAILGIKQGIKYLFVEEKEILKLVLYAGVISCEITGLLTIAFPYIIRNTLQYSTTVYGYAEGSLGIVAIGATFYYSFTRRKWDSNKTNNLVIGIGGCVMITGIILWMCQTRNVIFITILVLCSIIQFNINIFSIVCLSDIMRKTKEEYMGRIMGFVSMITNLFQPISQIIYGRGLEYTISGFGKFLIVIAVSILGISLYRKI